ncbi:DUF2065 domain-containing protein [Desulfobotulus sp. H1]|uniref:DUF2065 domain-containing protein n=1 Tax=Desulfobotulus pelophilus TaxID=2823377 RepID=A0ABT3NAX0_9BACT|nr:DUF2065 domain-containing protein [Desulfobotulus pelophilus]MCW7754615.1 DUF2065 domain-containing protein [Desulfobotulus pelophilus]
MAFFLCVIGMVMIVEGIPYFAFPEKMKRMLAEMQKLPAARLRRFGFVLMMVGLALVYLGRGL